MEGAEWEWGSKGRINILSLSEAGEQVSLAPFGMRMEVGMRQGGKRVEKESEVWGQGTCHLPLMLTCSSLDFDL